MPIPADLSEAFDQAVKELIAWDGGGDEPSVNVGGRPMLISTIAGLVETRKGHNARERILAHGWLRKSP
jgi:hypothetical protein